MKKGQQQRRADAPSLGRPQQEVRGLAPAQRKRARDNREADRVKRRAILERTACGRRAIDELAAGADTRDIDHLPLIVTRSGAPLRHGLRGRVKDNGVVEIEDDEDEDEVDTKPPMAPPVVYEFELSLTTFGAIFRAARRAGIHHEELFDRAVHAMLDLADAPNIRADEATVTVHDHAIDCAWQDGTSECNCNREAVTEEPVRSSPAIIRGFIRGPDNLQAAIDAHVIRVFNESGRNVSETARRLGIERSTVKRQYMFRLGLVAAETNRGPVKRIEVIASLADKAKIPRTVVRRRCSSCGQLGCRIDRCPTATVVPVPLPEPIVKPSLLPKRKCRICQRPGCRSDRCPQARTAPAAPSDAACPPGP